MKGLMDFRKLAIGDKVSITANKKTRTGEVVMETDHFYTIQFQNYKECFLKKDIENGVVKVEMKGDLVNE